VSQINLIEVQLGLLCTPEANQGTAHSASRNNGEKFTRKHPIVVVIVILYTPQVKKKEKRKLILR